MNVIFLVILTVSYFSTFIFRKIPIQFEMTGSYEKVYEFFPLLSSIFAIILKAYPYLILLILINIGLASLEGKLHLHQRIFNLNKFKNIWTLLFFVLIIISFINFSYLNYFYLDRMPHVPDAITYASQAKIFFKGKLFLDSPLFAEFFPVPGMINYHNKWFSQYTFGHPLILSLGYLINLPWLIPPILGMLSLIFIFLIGREIYSQRVGFWAAYLTFSSPFFQMNSINFMSHNSALLFTLISVFFLIKTIKGKSLIYSLLTGLFIGFLVNIRPYTAFLIALPIILSLKGSFLLLFPLLTGITSMVLIYFGYNYALADGFILDLFSLSGSPTRIFGFSESRTILHALQDIYTNLFLLDKTLLGWPLGLTFIYLFVYLLTSVIKKWEYLFIGIIVSLIGGYIFYKGSWMMYGPRFWYEMIPFLIFLIVLGVENSSNLFPRLFQQISKPGNISVIFSYILIFLLSLLNLKNWYSEDKNPRWYQDYTPENIGELKNFNYANRGLINVIEQKGITNALIFITPSFDWWTYGVPSYHLDLSLQGDIVYAVDLGEEKNKLLMKFYPNKVYYKADYNKKSINLYFPGRGYPI